MRAHGRRAMQGSPGNRLNHSSRDVSQMRRAAVSIPSNIAEGEGRTGRDPLRFLDIAYGSLLELETQLELARRLGFLPDGNTAQLTELTAEIGRMRNRLQAASGRALKPDP